MRSHIVGSPRYFLMTLNRMIHFTLVAALVISLTGCGKSRPDRDHLLTLSKELIEMWNMSWNSYDLDVVDELFLPEPGLTYFSSEKEGVIRGMEAVREHHVGFGFMPGGKEQENRLWLEEVGYDLFDTSVVITAIWYFARPEETGPPQKGPVTFVLVFRDDQLKISHCNFSAYLPEPDAG